MSCTSSSLRLPRSGSVVRCARTACRPDERPTAAPLNRELSLLAFNRRVLALAADRRVPLLERLRFLCILGSNLDEFFEIRVAGIKEQLRSRIAPAGMTSAGGAGAAAPDRRRGARADRRPVPRCSTTRCCRRSRRRACAWCAAPSSTPRSARWVAHYFEREVRPLLTPIGLDPAHPFPQVVNKSLNFIVELSGTDAFGRDTSIAIVKAPRVLPRIIKLPASVAGDDTRS